jgi:hypothetical protein
VPLVQLGHAHDARVGKRHRSVPIFLMQPLQSRDVLLDAKGDPERTVVQKPEQRILRPR